MPGNEYFELGYVSGIRNDGTLTLFLDVDHPEDYQALESVLIEKDQELIPFFIDSFRLTGDQKALMVPEEMPEEALLEGLKGCRIFLPANMLPDLGPDRFYYHEIIGFTVYEEQKGYIGTVQDVYQMPAEDVMVLDLNGSEVLVPLYDQFLSRIDKESGKITVTLPESFLDIYLS